MDALGGPQLGQLLVDQPLADGLRDRREPRLAPQRHQREPAPLALVDQGGRQGRPPSAQLDHQAGRAGLHQAGDEPGQRLVVVAQRDAGRQHQVAAAQQRPDVGELGGVHPAHLAVELPGTGEDFRVGPAHRRHLEHVGHGEHA